jgi:serpin B
MKKVLVFILCFITLLAVVGCTQPVAASEQKSDKPRETTPGSSQSDLEKLTGGNSTFALNLYRFLKEKEEGNLFYSPYSISEALAMTWGGARGDTERQMAETLQFLLSQEKLHPAFNSIDIELARRGQGAQGKDNEGFRLRVVNAIWGQQGFKFNEEYLDLLATNYGAGMRLVDYVKATEQARQTINQWVSDQTEDRIRDLLPEGSLTDMTRLVLTNAIYFNAAWACQFNAENTQDGQFNLLDGGNVIVPMMKQMSKMYSYAEGLDYQAIALPYDGYDLSMIVLLPGEGQFEKFEDALDYQKMKSIMDSMKSSYVNLTMPRFKIESEFGLKQVLSDMGMPEAFSETEADFSGMNGDTDLHISDVVHKSFVAVDEAGTEAAAATGVIVGTTSMPSDIKDVTMDRPFIFLIQDDATGTILFLGRVLNPGA